MPLPEVKAARSLEAKERTSVTMSPREKKALKHHVNIMKLERQLKQNQKFNKMSNLNMKRLKDKLRAEQ